MASPTLRSSSTTVPRPSFRSWLTSIPDLPSTADTVTGTSNTASRSEALRLTSTAWPMSPNSSALASCGAPCEARSGSSISSLPDMGLLLLDVGRAIVGEAACDQLGQHGLDGGFATLGAAAAPLDAAVGAL